jgi:hypothetical protein
VSHALRTCSAQAGDADHEEFVEVVRRDRQEAQLLEQRMAEVPRLFQDAAVELQPGQLAIDEAVIPSSSLVSGADFQSRMCRHQRACHRALEAQGATGDRAPRRDPVYGGE